MSDPVEFNISQDDLIQGVRRYCRTGKTLAPARKSQFLGAAIAVVMLLLAAVVLVVGTFEQATGAGFFVVIMIVVFVVSQLPPGRALANGAETNLRAHDGRLMIGPTRLSWIDGGLLVESRYMASLYRPGSIHAVWVSDEDVIVERPDRSVLVVPMRAFAGTPEAEAFAAEIRERLVNVPASTLPDASAAMGRPAYPAAPPTSPEPPHPPTTPTA